MTRLSDAEVARLREGDAELFRVLIREHTPALLAWVGPYAEGPDEADDLAQNVWQRVVTKCSTYRATGSFRGWLYQVARTVCIDHIRRRSSGQRHRERIEAHMRTEVDSTGVGLHEPRDHSAVRCAVDELPARQREVVTLRILDGRSTRETAEMMGCAVGTVKASLSHALGNLRGRLAGAAGVEQATGTTTNHD